MTDADIAPSTQRHSAPQTDTAFERRRRRFRPFFLIAALALVPLSQAAAAGFLPPIVNSTTVPANGDLNPYGVAIVPPGFPANGAIQAGDILVSNFNASSNLQGTGSTIIKLTANGTIAPPGTATVFFQGSPGLGLTTALGVLKGGFVLVGNVPTTDGTIGTIQAGSLLVIDRNGHLVTTIPSGPSSKLDGPWDLTIFDHGNHAEVFVSNVLNGTVTRLELAVGASTVTLSRATLVGAGYPHAPNAAALVLGPTGLAYNPADDTLFVASTADNTIYAIHQAATTAGSLSRGTIVSTDPHLRGPLALGFAPNGDLLAANGDAVNADPAHPSEIVELTQYGWFVSEFNVDSSQGGAFGLAVGATPAGPFSLAVVDDVTNSVVVYPLAP